MNDITLILGVVMAMAFFVNIVVQLTKQFIHIPTKLWAMLVAFLSVTLMLCAAESFGWFKPTIGIVILSVMGSLLIAFIAMYGFDTFKELWIRFKDGENIGS